MIAREDTNAVEIRNGRVFIDGHEIKGVRHTEFSDGADDVTLVRIDFLPSSLKVVMSLDDSFGKEDVNGSQT